MLRFTFLVMVCALVIASCAAPAAPTATPSSNMAFAEIPKPGSTPPSPAAQILPTATFIPNTTILDVSIWAPPYLSGTMGAVLPDPLRGLFAIDEATASIRLEVGETNRVSQWVYALVTPFPSTLQGVTGDELLSRWQGGLPGIHGSLPLLMDSNTREMFSAWWGPPAAEAVQVMPEEDLIDYAWAHRPALAIIPFEALEPRWRVLPVDGLSPIQKDFGLENYRLKIPISLNSDSERAALIRSNFEIPVSNLVPEKLTVVALTGVTALVRATAFEMEQHGVTYPAQDIRGWLLGADITHISNEVPFAENCPYPDPVQPDVRFCSRDSTIQLLEDIGTDVVELTGDHFQDWGTEAMFHTLEMYRSRGWSYYGGGTDLFDGRKALVIEMGPNRMAFIGCNAKGGSFAQASDAHPGAVPCDMDWMAQEVSRLAQEGYLVIATFQHHEYYTYAAQPDQQRDFRRMAEAGAVIVSGSQAHQPQGMEFLNGSFIHYGLGNLFFDQYTICTACGQGLIDRHVFYDGRYISTELLPIQFVDYARSRPMTVLEANELMEVLFQASGWQ